MQCSAAAIVPGDRSAAANVGPRQLDADTILRTFLDHRVEFVVIGGLAVAFHGFPRGTKDVDIVPAQNPENRARLFEALMSLEAQPLDISASSVKKLSVPFTREALSEGGNWAFVTRPGRVDVHQRIDGIETFEQLRANAVEAEVPGIGVLIFVGYDDLVTMKRAVGRAHDARDLEELRAIREES